MATYETLELIVNNVAYALSGEGQPYRLISAQGVGIPPSRRLRQRGPQQHGSSNRGFRHDERMITLSWIVDAETEALLDEYLADLVDILKPLTDIPVTLRFTRVDGVKRLIDAYLVGEMDFPRNTGQRMGASQIVVAQFEALYPIFRDSALRNVNFGTSLNEGFQVPMVVPWVQVGGTEIDGTVQVVYAGDFPVFPVIYITGPAEDCVITNLTTGDKLDFTGYVIDAGEVVTIDLAYEAKTVTHSVDGDVEGELTADSDKANFRLERSPVANGGINEIRVQVADQATTATNVRIEYYDQFLSIE